MRFTTFAGLAGLGLGACLVAARAADLAEVYPGCTGPAACTSCAPACKATWDEKKSSKSKYSMKCEYACARDRDSWHAPPPECRPGPPCGAVYVKKRLYKVDGPEQVEKVPKYEVQMVPAEPCHCAACRGSGPLCWLNPFALFQ
jgi:hypothetical protein